jgi:hypothetical protein
MNTTAATTAEIQVVNKRRDAYDVYIGRGSIWGNPFILGKDGDRATVIRKFEDYLASKPELIARLPELLGKRIACFCAPLDCHGHVLKRWAERLSHEALEANAR